jgi:hypothetical protein
MVDEELRRAMTPAVAEEDRAGSARAGSADAAHHATNRTGFTHRQGPSGLHRLLRATGRWAASTKNLAGQSKQQATTDLGETVR